MIKETKNAKNRVDMHQITFFIGLTDFIQLVFFKEFISTKE